MPGGTHGCGEALALRGLRLGLPGKPDEALGHVLRYRVLELRLPEPLCRLRELRCLQGAGRDLPEELV